MHTIKSIKNNTTICWYSWTGMYLWDMLLNHTAWFVPSFMMIGSGTEAILLRLLLPQQFQRLWFYWWFAFMKYATEMVSGAMMHISSFYEDQYRHSEVVREKHTKTASWSHKPIFVFFFQNKKSMLKRQLAGESTEALPCLASKCKLLEEPKTVKSRCQKASSCAPVLENWLIHVNLITPLVKWQNTSSYFPVNIFTTVIFLSMNCYVCHCEVLQLWHILLQPACP